MADLALHLKQSNHLGGRHSIRDTRAVVVCANACLEVHGRPIAFRLLPLLAFSYLSRLLLVFELRSPHQQPFIFNFMFQERILGKMGIVDTYMTATGERPKVLQS